MATLTLGISVLSSRLTVPDANAQRVLETAFALFHQHEWVLDKDGLPTDVPVTYTPQQKLDWITWVLIPQMLVDKAQQYEEMAAIRAAKQSVADDPPILTVKEKVG
jgi:hypothetical protein